MCILFILHSIINLENDTKASQTADIYITKNSDHYLLPQHSNFIRKRIYKEKYIYLEKLTNLKNQINYKHKSKTKNNIINF